MENYTSYGPEVFFSGAFASFFIAALITTIICYVFTAIGLSSLAKNNGYKDKAFLAWIPVASIYLVGVLAGENGRTSFTGAQLAVFYIISAFLASIPIFGWIIALSSVVAYIYILIDLFERMDFESPVFMNVLCSFVPFVQILVIYINRDKVFNK